MNEKVAAALRKIAEDENLLAKLRACADPDEAYAVASSVGNGFTKEEFLSAMDELRASAQNATDVSNEELSKMAGGSVLTLDGETSTFPPYLTSIYAVTANNPNI